MRKSRPGMKRFQTLFVGALLLLGGCAKDSASGPETKPADKELLALGWADFESKRYDDAISNFTDAYVKGTTLEIRSEALCGRGWSYAYKRVLSTAKGDFVFAADLTGVPTRVMNDLRVGAAFVLYALNDFSGAASNANEALSANSSYAFTHDVKVTTTRVRLLLAQSYYALGQFSQCAAQLDLIKPTAAPHPTDPSSLLGSITALLNSL